MSSNGDDHDKSVDALVDALMSYIDDATPGEIVEFAVRRNDRAAVVALARARVELATKEAAQQRRESTAQRMGSAASVSAPDVSGLSATELRAIFAAHVANDDASATMAARHEKGEMDEAELRSVVADILRLQQKD